jgi:hypothetical protein
VRGVLAPLIIFVLERSHSMRFSGWEGSWWRIGVGAGLKAQCVGAHIDEGEDLVR